MPSLTYFEIKPFCHALPSSSFQYIAKLGAIINNCCFSKNALQITFLFDVDLHLFFLTNKKGNIFYGTDAICLHM